MNLQAERTRPSETGGPTEPLKWDARSEAEGEVHGVGGGAGSERVARGPGDHPLGVPVERVGSAVDGLGSAVKAVEECRSARTDDQRAGRTRQQLVQRERPRGDVECRARQREKNVQAQLTQRTGERRQKSVARLRTVARVRSVG
jgi:hypothetical protein